MAVFRINKDKNFITMGKYHLKEKDMSLKAIGLLSIMLSLPDEWDYSVAGLTAIRKEGKNSINSILNELEEFGYLTRNMVYENGKISNWEYNIYEKPKNLYPKNEDIENEDIENVDIENRPQLNNKQLNTNIINELNNKYFEDERLNDTVIDWLEYKKEKRQAYKPRGLKALIKRIDEYVGVYGVDTIIELIEHCMANNWQGITWNKLKQPISSGTGYQKNQEQNKTLGGILNGSIKLN